MPITRATISTLTQTAAATIPPAPAVAGPASTFVFRPSDMSVTVFGSQAAGFTLFPLSDAHSVPYTPTTLANWSNNNPRTLQLALDRIAAKIGPIP